MLCAQWRGRLTSRNDASGESKVPNENPPIDLNAVINGNLVMLNGVPMGKQLKRREFVKNSALLLGGLGALGGVGHAEAAAETRTRQLSLAMAGYRFPRTEALFTGKVKIDGCESSFDEAGIGDINSNLFGGKQSWDVTEIGLHPFMLAYANEGFRDYSLLPIFPLRTFRHKSIFIRTDRGIRKPEDLRGKSIATPGYSSTSLTWIRGILQDEYGVKPEEIEWVYSRKDSSAEISGKVSAQENVLPDGISIRPGPVGVDESDLLENGEVDALFHAVTPRVFVQGHDKVARLFPDSRAVEQAYFRRTGIFPIMHAVAVRRPLLDDNPWLARAIFDAYSQAKSAAYRQMNVRGWVDDMLPWYGQELEQTRDVMGGNFYSYGLGPNKQALETLFRYSHEQGLSSKRLTVGMLFHPSGLEFAEAT
jgi:4,5-dihydroxyphthalate decarboxylase